MAMPDCPPTATPSAARLDSLPVRLAGLTALERRHNGPIPADELAAVLAGGAAAAAEQQRCGLAALHQRLATEACLGLARRRRTVMGALVLGDSWLVRLERSLAAHRQAAIGLRVRRGHDFCLGCGPL